MIKLNLAPIVLFVYNRPWHTQKTLEALSRNNLAEQSILYIYADGPKNGSNEQALKKIADTRAIAKSKNWCKEVCIIERENNAGLAESIISGVTETVNKYGKVIVLEDDIVTSTSFLKFMNQALDIYELEEKVWHISGYWYPAKGSSRLDETFFFCAATCWGWATWQRSWYKFTNNAIEIKDRILKIENAVSRFNIEDAYPFFDQLQLNINNIISTWAVKWYGSIFLNGGLSLHPRQSFTNNIGLDGSGINCETSSVFAWPVLADKVKIKKIPIVESTLSRVLLKRFFNQPNHSPNFSIQLKLKLKNLLKKGLKLIGVEVSKHRIGEFDYLKKLERYKKVEIPLFGNSFLVADAMSFYYSYEEIFKSDIYKFEAKTDRPFIIDCGCNYGASILYFKTIFPYAEVVGFEPDPFIFEIAQKNITQYNLKNVVLYNKGLWKEETILNFYSEKADGGSLELITDHSEHELIQVATTILSKFIKHKKVDFLKIDIEGAELDVMIECEPYLMNVSNIFIEYHSFKNTEQKLDILLAILTRNKFRYRMNTVGGGDQPFIKRAKEGQLDLQLNIFATRD
jgi:FkbM family methyltransferase